jgi:pimeloyl-ACP methyl ester carboxylesterase
MSDSDDPIEVRAHGVAGPFVGVLHGGPGAPGSVSGLVRVLAQSFRVLEPWQRGSGGERLTVARHVADLAEVAPERAVVWVGHSWGAMLALSFAARYPERTRGVVLVGCGTYDVASRAIYQQRMRAIRERRGDLARVDALLAQLNASEDADERTRIRLELAFNSAEVMTVDAVEAPDLSGGVDVLSNRETWEDAMRLQREGIEPALFSAITAPVLMLHGDDDPHPGDETYQTLKRCIPQLEYRAFPRCGHEPWRERYAREPFLGALQGWLHAHAG